MSNETIVYSSDYSVLDIWDRIINVRLERADRKADYSSDITIRSDYEEVWNGNTLYFKTCQPKPEIKVQYKQYDKTVIEVDIFITNFNIIEAESNDTGTSAAITDKINAVKTVVNNAKIDVKKKVQELGGDASKVGAGSETVDQLLGTGLFATGNPIVKAYLEMGYRGQMFRWDRWSNNNKGLSQDDAYLAFKQLREPILNNNSPTGKFINNIAAGMLESQLMFNQRRQLVIDVAYMVHQTVPPDRITRIHGFVGSASAGSKPFYFNNVNNSAGVTSNITADQLKTAMGHDGVRPIDSVLIDTWFKDNDDNYTDKLQTLFDSGAAPKNFFNQGNAIDPLEAYCFNFVTRRFPKTNVPLYRSPELETATANYYASVTNMDHVRINLKADIVNQAEKIFSDFRNLSTEKQDKKIEKELNKRMASTFCGPRYVIKNLDIYHAFYEELQLYMKHQGDKGNFINIWDAAYNVGNHGRKESVSITTVFAGAKPLIKGNEISLEDYLIKANRGEFKTAYAALKVNTGGDVPSSALNFILPVEPLSTVAGGVSLTDTKVNVVNVDGTTKLVSLNMFAGMFTVRDAYLFGAPVLCSIKAKEAFKPTAQARNISVVIHDTADRQMNWIAERFGLQYFKLNNGGYFLYQENETVDDLIANFFNSEFNPPFTIPAVYDVTLSPVREIRMPFISFLDPLQIVEWTTRDTIGQLVSFYYRPELGRNYFRIISNEVQFSTVEDDANVSLLKVVDTALPASIKNTTARTAHHKIGAGNTLDYIDCIIILDGKIQTWLDIYDSEVMFVPDLFLAHFEDSENKIGSRINGTTFLTMMRQWNPTLFNITKHIVNVEDENESLRILDDWAEYEDRQANKKFLNGGSWDLFVFPNILNCFSSEKLPQMDLTRIFLRFPVMDSIGLYGTKLKSDKFKHDVLVYQNGTWITYTKTSWNKRYLIEPR